MPPLGGIFNRVKYGRTSINLILDSTGGRMGRITSFSKQVIVFFLVTALIIRPTFAAVGGWDLKNPVAQGASTVYDATKNVVINGKQYIKESSVKITPTASGVAKVLARGAAGYALSVAVQQLLGSVDWVLDPANNQIRYTEPVDPKDRYVYTFQNVEYVGPDAVCNAYFSNLDSTSIKMEDKNVQLNNGGESVTCTATRTYSCYNGTRQCKDGVRYEFYRSAIVDGPTEEEKTLPLPVVAQKVISNAAGGDAAAQAATTAAAADIVAESENDEAKARPIASQAEANATTKPADAAEAEKANEATGTQTQNPTKPDTTDLKLEFPIFCNWAPTVCEAAQIVISFPKTLTNWWETGKSKAEEWATSISEAWTKVKEEYANKPEENTDTKLDIPDPTPPDINTDIFFGGSCPASRSVPVSFAGISTEIEFSFQWFCEIASIAKPVIISISAFAAALIVAGVRTEDD